MATKSITFDRFDGGLMLARPSSVSPANSLANLFNMDVQPGGWLRSRANWRRASLYTSTGPGILNLGNRVLGLRANGGYLWAFALTAGDVPADFTSVSATGDGRLYALDSVNGDHLAIGIFDSGVTGATSRLAGATPWGAGFLAVVRNETAGQWNRAAFDVSGIYGPYASVNRTDIADVNMPNSGLMVTIQNRVFAISDDGKTVRFCAVGDVTDWTTSGDAGFLAVSQHFGSGQRAYGLGAYQGKLAVFTDKSVQLWTVDPDPTAMAIDNVVDGVGSRHHESIVSLNGDLLFLADTGVRSLTTLQSSLFPSDVDVGLPVRSIAIAPALTPAANIEMPYSEVQALGAMPFGQYWVASPDTWTFGGASEYGWLAWSYSRQAKLNAWAWHGAGGQPRAKVVAWASLGNRVFMRSTTEPYLLVMTPDVFSQDQTDTGAYALCAMTTQWLDFGKPGRRKSIVGIDFDGLNIRTISILVSAGGNRGGILADTIAVGSAQDGWTYSGELLPVNADGTEFRISFSGGGIGETQLNKFTIHFVEVSD